MSAALSRAPREAAIKAAEEKGCVVVEPKDNQLFIDIDSADDRQWFDSSPRLTSPCCRSRRPQTESPRRGPCSINPRAGLRNRERPAGGGKASGGTASCTSNEPHQPR